MHSCEAHQNLLLEYVFEVLDDVERGALQAHLAECAACRAALVRTQEQQRLLTAAARLECADVHFEAPAADPVQPVPAPTVACPAVLPLPRRDPVRWRRWAAVAAALLVVAVPTGIYAYSALKKRSLAADEVARHEEKINAEKTKLDEIANEQRRIPQRLNEKLQAVVNAQRERQLKLVVTGPGTVQSGAPAEFQIQTFNLNDQPADADVEVFVSTEAGKQGKSVPVVPVVEQGRRKAGAYRLTLPQDLPLPPGSHPTLVVHAKREAGPATELSESLELVRSTYVTHLATDKPMYQPGETVYFRSLTLDRSTLRPVDEKFHLIYRISNSQVRDQVVAEGSTALLAEDPTGKNQVPVKGPDGKPVQGIGSGSLALSAGAPGGEYVLSVEDALGRFPRQERRFVVNEYQKHVLQKKLDFNRKTYGAGDEVQALCKAAGVNGPVKNAKVEATVLIDGQTYGVDGKPSAKPIVFKTDDEGTVTVRFTLPASILKGQATLSVKFDPYVETLPRTIPIVLKKLQLEFFPEGGDLVARLPNRVYFQARTTLGKPADLRGVLLEDGKPLDVAVQTLTDDKEPGVNQGMGRFEFTPKAGSKYALKVESPVGVTDRYELPAVRAEGVILSAPQGVVAAGKPIRVTVRSSKPQQLLVGAYCRGRLLDSVHLKEGQTTAVLNPTTGDGGVCRVTVFRESPANANRRELTPVAERLIYRQAAEKLRVVVKPDHAGYVPGQPAKLTVEALDEKERPAAAVVMLAVADKSVLSMADEKTFRTMPTHFLLTTEVRRSEDLEYADFLVGTHPRAADALDLLLGTQGWRRFAEQNPTEFRKNLKDPGDAAEADRLLVSIGQSMPLTRDFAHEEIEKVHQEFDHEAEEVAARHQQANQSVEAAKNADDYKAAVATLKSQQQAWEDVRGVLFPALTAVLFVAIFVCFFVALAREPRRAVPYYLGMAACMILVSVVFLNWGPSGDEQTKEKEAPRMAMRPAGGMNFGGLRGAADAEPDMNAQVMDDAEGMRAPRGGGAFADVQKDANRKGDGLGAEGKAKMPAHTPPPPGAAEKPGQGIMNQAKGGEVKKFLADKVAKRDGKDADEKAANGIERQQAFQGRGAAAPMLARGLNRDRALEQVEVRDARFHPARGPMAGNALEAEGLRRMGGRAELRAVTPLVVREYAHKHDDKAGAAERSDFAETLFWHPVLVLADGKTDVSFALCDSVTTFQATAFAHTADGRLGAATVTFDSRLPFTLHPRTPIEVTAGDTVTIPVTVANNTGSPSGLTLKLKEHAGLDLIKGDADKLTIEGETARRFYTFRPNLKRGEAVLAFEGKADAFPADTVKTPFRIVPEGFPRAGSVSDMLEGSATQTIKLGEAWIPGTLQVAVQVYPSTLADLQQGLDSLLREPNGCFEQTSTSSYPNVLILDYLRSTKSAKPEVEKKARDLLSRGYQKLTSFECANQQKQAREGYEWFGGAAPPHEALTAYGLLQFRDMARFQEVDPAMIRRTQDYLLSRRDGKGGFLRNDRALDTFGRAPKHITDAYIAWAMTESGCEDALKTELDALLALAKDSKDPYFVSLVANSLINKARTADAMPLLRNVAAAQKDDGHLDGLEMSITSSRGHDLQVETTALAVMGWLKANPGEFIQPVKKAVDWVGKQRGGYGGFGSTQATILALKALIANTKAPREIKAGELAIYLGEEKVASTAFKAGVYDTIVLPWGDADKRLKPGDNKLRVELTGGNVLPFTLAWTYQTKQPALAGDCPLRLETTLGKTKASEGDLVRLTAKLRNTSKAGQGMALAIIGLPGGMTVPEDFKQLKDYAKLPEDGSRPLIAAFELRGRELVLYWRDLQPEQEIEVPIDLVCRIPGEYTGPASRAYLYYNAESKCWINPLAVTITPGK